MWEILIPAERVAIGDWLYRVVAGLELDPDRPAYKHILIQPLPGGGLVHAEAKFDSQYGLVSSAWRRNGSQMKLTVVIPPNTSAQITLPNAHIEIVHTENKMLEENKYFRNLRQMNDTVMLEVGSGSYEFEW